MAIVAPYLPYDKLRRSADEFLARYHPDGTMPVPIENIIEYKFGLDIVPVPGLLEDQYGWIEYQAYCWGGLVLVPEGPLKDKFDDCIAKAGLAGVDWNELDQTSRRPILGAIGRVFDVSSEVIIKRMKYDKLG